MQLKRFNDKGISAFREYLTALRDDPTLPPPLDLLDKPSLIEPLVEPIEADSQAFSNRMDFARWLYNAAQSSNGRVPLRDKGFWSWLSLWLFDEVCPLIKGKRNVKELPRYLPDLDNSRRYYRHALLGPFLIFTASSDNPNKVQALLAGSLHRLTDEAYRLYVENQLLVYPSAVAVLTDLYYDPQSKKLRRGSQSKTAPGSIRRLVKVLYQYARTYDLDLLSEDDLSTMLPSEFHPWQRLSQKSLVPVIQ